MPSTDPHERFFARWSRFYESTPVFARFLRRQQDHALERLAPASSDRVLDLGCGPGRAMEVLWRAGARPIGADLSLEMLVKATIAPRVCSRAGALPFRDGAFTAVLCTNSFHHYEEPLATLREIHRVLGASGRAVLVDPNLENPLARLTVFGGEALTFGMSVHLHAPAEWISLCAAAGFGRATVEPLSVLGVPGVSLCIVAIC